MKHLKVYEHIFDEVREYLINKFVVVKPEGEDYYLIEVKEEMVAGFTGDDFIISKKLYVLRKDGSIKKSKPHNKFITTPERLKKLTIYKSKNLIEAYDVLKSMYDSKKYNL